MVAELTPGTPAAGRLPAGRRIPIGQTLPDVNLDEILAGLDADTRTYLRMLLGDAAGGLRGTARPLADTLRRFEPTARDLRRVNAALALRRRHLARAIHDFSLLAGELGAKDDELATFVNSSNAVLGSLARQDSNLRATLRGLPAALTDTRRALGRAQALGAALGPTLQALRPGARALGPSLRQTRPFLRQSTPIIRDEIRPFTRAALPTVKELRPAMRDLAAATPDLTRTFTVVNRLLNEISYNPPGKQDEGYLFWQTWVNHAGDSVFSTQDAHGPIRRGLVLLSCSTAQLLNAVAGSNEQLGTLVDLLNAPTTAQICPQSATPFGTR